MTTATNPRPNISIEVDLTNPGQFFACCGLLELTDRLWPGSEGWFDANTFRILSDGTLDELLQAITATDLEQLDPNDHMASPIHLAEPFDVRLDWWCDGFFGGKRLKVWAGSMRNVRIARAMQQAMVCIPDPEDLFDYATVVYDPDQPKKKVEPYYFDSRRGRNAQSLDIGFAPDSLNMTSAAYPAVEFLCLIGLQRYRPALTKTRRVFRYHAWANPLPARVASAAACGNLLTSSTEIYRFENAFRTDQRRHKSFLPATPVGA